MCVIVLMIQIQKESENGSERRGIRTMGKIVLSSLINQLNNAMIGRQSPTTVLLCVYSNCIHAGELVFG